MVANKFLTGFDETLLHKMYVDKKLQSVDEIRKAFDPFYTSTTLSQPTDVYVLHDLKEALDGVGVYEWSEVKQFNQLFFNKAEADQLSPLIDTAAHRFDHELELELENEAKIDFKIKAKQFVKIYAQVSFIIPFNNMQWEMLHWFLKITLDANASELDPQNSNLQGFHNEIQKDLMRLLPPLMHDSLQNGM